MSAAKWLEPRNASHYCGFHSETSAASAMISRLGAVGSGLLLTILKLRLRDVWNVGFRREVRMIDRGVPGHRRDHACGADVLRAPDLWNGIKVICPTGVLSDFVSSPF
jgi:hypothetical protein